MTVAEIRDQTAQAAFALHQELSSRILGQEYPDKPGYRAVEIEFRAEPHHVAQTLRGGGSVRCASTAPGAEDFWIGTNSFIADGELARMLFDRFSPICPMLYNPFCCENIWEVDGLSPPSPAELVGPGAEHHRATWLADVESEEREDRRWAAYPKKNRPLRCGHIAPHRLFEDWENSRPARIWRAVRRQVPRRQHKG